VTGQINYTHLADLNDVSLFGSMQLPIFDRNQGEIKRAGFVPLRRRRSSKCSRTGRC
jgi:hypothetical protein